MPSTAEPEYLSNVSDGGARGGQRLLLPPGAIFAVGGADLSYFAINYNLGFGIPMLVGTAAGAISFVIALLLGPETRGKESYRTWWWLDGRARGGAAHGTRFGPRPTPSPQRVRPGRGLSVRRAPRGASDTTSASARGRPSVHLWARRHLPAATERGARRPQGPTDG